MHCGTKPRYKVMTNSNDGIGALFSKVVEVLQKHQLMISQNANQDHPLLALSGEHSTNLIDTLDEMLAAPITTNGIVADGFTGQHGIVAEDFTGQNGIVTDGFTGQNGSLTDPTNGAVKPVHTPDLSNPEPKPPTYEPEPPGPVKPPSIQPVKPEPEPEPVRPVEPPTKCVLTLLSDVVQMEPIRGMLELTFDSDANVTCLPGHSHNVEHLFDLTIEHETDGKVETIDLSKEGVYEITWSIGEVDSVTYTLQIKDTAPHFLLKGKPVMVDKLEMVMQTYELPNVECAREGQIISFEILLREDDTFVAVKFKCTTDFGEPKTLLVEITIDSAPMLKLLPEGTPDQSLGLYEEWVDPGYTVQDDRDLDLKVGVSGDVVDTNQFGTYIVKYTTTDSAGNTTSMSRNVTVEADGIDPLNTIAITPPTSNDIRDAKISSVKVQFGTTKRVLSGPQSELVLVGSNTTTKFTGVHDIPNIHE